MSGAEQRVDRDFPLAAARALVQRCQTAVAQRGVCHLMLAGGSTPVALYRLLATSPLARSVPWDALHLWQGDERGVPPEHPDSNWGMVQRELLANGTHHPAAGHRMEAEGPSLDRAAQRYEALLRAELPLGRAGTPGLDILLLGVGADGHTASLFPGAAALDEQERLVVGTARPPHGSPGLTITLPLVAAARQVWFLSRVRGKRPALRAALAGSQTAPAGLAARGARAVVWWFDAAV